MPEQTAFWSDSRSANFHSLSVKDLLYARDLYHFHLLNKSNVIGTAIGLYLIRTEEDWPTRSKPAADRPKGERRFDNSQVRPYSWPCVIVIVKAWVDDAEFGSASGKVPLHDVVPKTLYLPDGRTVPVCVVAAHPAEEAPASSPQWFWPESKIGGGFPIVVDSQGVERVASVGCLVTDGHSVYALTNGHVTGPAGTPISTRFRGQSVVVGSSSPKTLSRLPFSEVYPEFAGHRTYLNLDIGLVNVADASEWTNRTYGLPGTVGPIADLDETSLTLNLIEKSVYAYGAASGPLRGTIKALFYRYRSVGGYDYVTDFLIAPPEGTERMTAPGDSGTVWHVIERSAKKPSPQQAKAPEWPAETDIIRPLAIEWGGQVFMDGSAQRNTTFALATSLSNVCKLLNVEVVRDRNDGARPFWGALGHYGIAAFAVSLVKDKKLKALLEANLDQITFDVDTLSPQTIKERLKQSTFVPLAMVPDYAWKSDPNNVRAGRGDAARGGSENPNHYSDVDQEWPGKNKSILQLCLENDRNVDVAVWQSYYDANGHSDPRKRGLLPFRIWQFFDEMVGFVEQEDMKSFLCAAGILSHYAGDACQPLHVSVYSNGDESRVLGEEWDSRKHKMVPLYYGKGIHSVYETKMLDRKSAELKEGVTLVLDRDRLKPRSHHVRQDRRGRVAEDDGSGHRAD